MAEQTTSAPRWVTAECSGATCRAPIIWAQTSRERMPVDVDTGAWPSHNITLTPGPGDVPLATVLTATQAGKAFGKPLYRSHFATCVEAGAFRRKAQRRRTA